MNAATPFQFRKSPPGVMLSARSRVEVRRLAVKPECPLYFWSLETLVPRLRRGAYEVFLKDGVYLATGHELGGSHYLLARGQSATAVTETAALLALDAFALLVDLELDDAAVSLHAGELLYARNQWVRWRYPT